MPVIGKGSVQSDLDLDLMAVVAEEAAGPGEAPAGERRVRAGRGARAGLAAAEARAAAPRRRHEQIPNSVGIVFVHGIGSQRPDEFLLQ